MASNYTPNFNLCQWKETDSVLRSDFNADNLKIEAALNDMPRFVAGSYQGDGKFGEENPRSLSFVFTPLIVVIVADSPTSAIPGAVFINGQTQSNSIGNYADPAYGLNLHLSWETNRVSWYTTAEGNYAEDKHLNKSGQTYRYFALGL